MYFPLIQAVTLSGPVLTLAKARVVLSSSVFQVLIGDYDSNMHNALAVPDNHNHNFEHDQAACLHACFGKEPACPLNMVWLHINFCLGFTAL